MGLFGVDLWLIGGMMSLELVVLLLVFCSGIVVGSVLVCVV